MFLFLVQSALLYIIDFKCLYKVQSYYESYLGEQGVNLDCLTPNCFMIDIVVNSVFILTELA